MHSCDGSEWPEGTKKAPRNLSPERLENRTIALDFVPAIPHLVAIAALIIVTVLRYAGASAVGAFPLRLRCRLFVVTPSTGNLIELFVGKLEPFRLDEGEQTLGGLGFLKLGPLLLC